MSGERKHFPRPRFSLSYTFTSAGRNSGLLESAFCCFEPGIEPLRVLQIGPGVTVKWLHERIQQAATGASWRKASLRKIESLVRKLPLASGNYTSFETDEILQSTTALDRPTWVTVMDVSARALSIVRHCHPQQDLELVLRDIAEPVHYPRVRYDLIVCCHVLGHIHEQLRYRQAIKNLVTLSLPNGVVLVNEDDVFADRTDMQIVVPHIYRHVPVERLDSGTNFRTEM